MRSRAVAVLIVGVLCLAACTSAASTDGEDAASVDEEVTDTSIKSAAVDRDDSVDADGSGSDDDDGSEDEAFDGADSSDDADDDTAADGDDAANAGAGPVSQNPRHLGPTGELDLGISAAERGDNGENVVAIQERLNDLGFNTGNADGDYGRRTEVAVSTFQRINELEPSGAVDGDTIEALTRYRYTGLRLVAGSEDERVEELQARLAAGPFDPGSQDGVYGTQTKQAIWALEKLAGIPVDGDWGPADEWALGQLLDGQLGQPEQSHDQRWVEVDLSQQLLKVYEPDSAVPVLISHVSSGSGIPWENEEHSGSSITPKGDFHIQRRINGWRESSLNIGRLYNPLYFTGGIAFHGATSVPLYPASHGCVRVPMHIAEYLPAELPNGTPVHVRA